MLSPLRHRPKKVREPFGPFKLFAETCGIPTGYAAPMMRDLISSDCEPQPVWHYPDGKVRGMAFSPLYRIAPRAAELDPTFYELLALVDSNRGGRARERDIAIKTLKKRLNRYAPSA